MNQALLESALESMLDRFPGVLGCALVDAGSGLVWHRQPQASFDGLWEASVDHWRLHQRLGRYFDSAGELGAIVTYHHEASLVLVPCLKAPDILLVCLARRGSAIDWVLWQRDAQQLGRRIKAAM